MRFAATAGAGSVLHGSMSYGKLRLSAWVLGFRA